MLDQCSQSQVCSWASMIILHMLNAFARQLHGGARSPGTAKKEDRCKPRVCDKHTAANAFETAIAIAAWLSVELEEVAEPKAVTVPAGWQALL